MGGGIGMGNTYKPMAVLFQCMTKFTTNKKKIKKKIKSAGHQSLGNCAQNLRQERNSSWYSCPQPFIASAMGEESEGVRGNPEALGNVTVPVGRNRALLDSFEAHVFMLHVS